LIYRQLTKKKAGITISLVLQTINGYSRKKWMRQLCETMLEFYPKEILKIKDRIGRFDNVKTYWELKADIWG